MLNPGAARQGKVASRADRKCPKSPSKVWKKLEKILKRLAPTWLLRFGRKGKVASSGKMSQGTLTEGESSVQLTSLY
jgi:hypothetical protein